MKKAFCTPEVHLIKLDRIQPGTDLSLLSDEELLAVMQQGGYKQNKTMYIANEEYLSRSVAGETILVPIDSQNDGLNGMITFNEAGNLMWEWLQKKCTKADLAYRLAKEYEKEISDVEDDVDQFVDRAVKRGFVIVCE